MIGYGSNEKYNIKETKMPFYEILFLWFASTIAITIIYLLNFLDRL